METKTFTITVFSENRVGLLNQITIVFTKRGLNIETLSVSQSAIKGIHKFTITLQTTEDEIEKVVKQKKIYPGYVFIQSKMNDKIRYIVRNTP